MLSRVMWGLLGAACCAHAAQISFDFHQFKVQEPPPGFTNVLDGKGEKGRWLILLDDVPSLLEPLTPLGNRNFKKGVLAQVARDPTDEHFPMLIYQDMEFRDFKVTTRFKLVAGEVERMAGIAFRYQDPDNYYYIRASGLGSTFNFFKVVDGQRSLPIGNQLRIASDVWHEMTIECAGSKIRATLNGKEVLPELDDRSFASGKIGFWTKSDSVVYFSDTQIDYQPRVSLAERLVEQTMQTFDRLLGLQIVVMPEDGTQPLIVASNTPKEVGTPGWPEEKEVIQAARIYHLKGRGKISVSLPLRDRNGEPMAALRVTMKSFPGQTEKNALARAMNVVKSLEGRVLAREELTR